MSEQTNGRPATFRSLAQFLGWGDQMTEAQVWSFAAERERLLRVAQSLLETEKSHAATAEAALRERIAILKSAGETLAPQEPNCAWPGCAEPALCTSGNFGGQAVCRDHFAITNGRAPQEPTDTQQVAMLKSLLFDERAKNTRFRAALLNLIESHGAARAEVQIAALTQARAALKGDPTA